MRREWDTIIERWTQYIQAGPEDGRAYMERGGAHHHKGDRQAALQDLARACELGTSEACGWVERLGGSR